MYADHMALMNYWPAGITRAQGWCLGAGLAGFRVEIDCIHPNYARASESSSNRARKASGNMQTRTTEANKFHVGARMQRIEGDRHAGDHWRCRLQANKCDVRISLGEVMAYAQTLI
jgi:hypothetical protein